MADEPRPAGDGPPAAGPILAVDYGRRRLGLAVSDGLGMAAHPLAAWTRRDGPADLAALREVVASRGVTRLVVGLPLNMDGSHGPMAAEARAWGESTAAALGLPLHMEDERLSTDEAESRLRELGLRPSDRKRRRDSIAAAIVLATVLERERD